MDTFMTKTNVKILIVLYDMCRYGLCLIYDQLSFELCEKDYIGQTCNNVRSRSNCVRFNEAYKNITGQHITQSNI